MPATWTSCYPVLCTPTLSESRDFFVGRLGFEISFEADWYVSLCRPGTPPYELGLLQAGHPTLPEGYRQPVGGVLINVEVDDVDAEWRRLVLDGGLTAELPLRSEAFGQRHFIVAEPGGALIDVITPIPPTAEFADNYVTT